MDRKSIATPTAKVRRVTQRTVRRDRHRSRTCARYACCDDRVGNCVNLPNRSGAVGRQRPRTVRRHHGEVLGNARRNRRHDCQRGRVDDCKSPIRRYENKRPDWIQGGKSWVQANCNGSVDGIRTYIDCSNPAAARRIRDVQARTIRRQVRSARSSANSNSCNDSPRNRGNH